jgi:undecaprenyl-diphosphatase
MVTLIETFILAVVQGLTEWLPISSSGHLVMTQEALGLKLPLIYDVMLHFGTVIVVLTVFRKDVVDIIRTLVKGQFQTEDGKLALFIVVGSIPTAIIGFIFHDFLESLFFNLPTVGVALLINGALLFLSEKRMGNKEMNIKDSLLIGMTQAIAIIPGISRSGATISTGLLRKIDKKTTFKFSFLLSAPAIVGATITESKQLALDNIDLTPILLGTIVSMLVGYASLRILQRIVLNEKFHLFAYYCWLAGATIILFTILLK